jgi:hypothetical protein
MKEKNTRRKKKRRKKGWKRERGRKGGRRKGGRKEPETWAEDAGRSVADFLPYMSETLYYTYTKMYPKFYN